MRADDAVRALEQAEHVDAVVGQLEIRQEVTAAAFGAARDRGALTVLNPAPAAPLTPALAEVTDWLVPNELELVALAATVGVEVDDGVDDAATLRAIASAFRSRVVVTLGERGAALLASDGGLVGVPAEMVEAVDTTGAGDAFVGAFVYGLAVGLPEERAVRLGCACATASVLRPGTQSSFPTREEAGRLAGNAISGVEEPA
jgi:ribokinase